MGVAWAWTPFTVGLNNFLCMRGRLTGAVFVVGIDSLCWNDGFHTSLGCQSVSLAIPVWIGAMSNSESWET